MIYLDNNATTAVDPAVLDAMLPFLKENYGNPSSSYSFGRRTAAALDTAREQVAALLGAEPRDILFTSCGTESDNTAIASALATTGHRHLVTTSVEHSAVKNQAEHLERLGYGVTWLPVAPDGQLDPAAVAEAIRPDTAIVSIMWANNETGVLFPIESIANLCAERGILFHTDAVQAVGKLPIRFHAAPIHFLALSGHKLHAPKGIGALAVRRRTRFSPLLLGGAQEKGKRGGTENVAAIVGLGRACELALARLDDENQRVRALRDRLETGILTRVPSARINGASAPRLPNTTNITFPGAEASHLLARLDQAGVCASAGSACTSGTVSPSHVLKAMGLRDPDALASIRFSLATSNTEAEIDHVLNLFPSILELPA
ncbi:MAG: cysteine desulfurase NifS [Verrucomicrobiia bacterium]